MKNVSGAKGKPEILSDKDHNEITSFKKDVEDGKLEKLAGLSSMLKKLIQNYEFEDFNLDAFKTLKSKHWADQFFDNKPLHAGNAYLILLIFEIVFTEGKQRDYYLITYERYCLYQIDRIEAVAATTRNIDFIIGAVKILFEMVVISSLVNNYKQLIVAYRRMLNLLSNLGIRDLQQKLFMPGYIEIFPKYLSKYINNCLFLVEFGHRIYGNNPNLINAFLPSLTYAQDDEPCLVIGETGTGKEIVARIIHRFSHRQNNNYQTRNCGNFTETLFDSEIQGIHWSAATNVGTQLGVFLASCGRTENNVDLGYVLIESKTAKGQKEISFASSSSSKTQTPSEEELNQYVGTIFLDEINSLPLELQSKLLRIIEQKEVNVLGEAKARRFKTKIICATNQDPRDDHEGKILRRDLFYRVGRGIVELPPLRKMKESIPEISIHLIRENTMNVQLGKKARNLIKISYEALDKLVLYDWPGNIRELENVLYRSLYNMSLEKKKVLEFKHLDFSLPTQTFQRQSEIKEGWTNVMFSQHEALYMEELYRVTNGIVARAAKLSGRGRTAVKNSWSNLGLK